MGRYPKKRENSSQLKIGTNLLKPIGVWEVNKGRISELHNRTSCLVDAAACGKARAGYE